MVHMTQIKPRIPCMDPCMHAIISSKSRATRDSQATSDTRTVPVCYHPTKKLNHRVLRERRGNQGQYDMDLLLVSQYVNGVYRFSMSHRGRELDRRVKRHVNRRALPRLLPGQITFRRRVSSFGASITQNQDRCQQQSYPNE